MSTLVRQFTLPLALACCTVASAQMHRVEKPGAVTRAIGVYEWTGEMDKPAAARLVPVSLFVSGHMEDAGTYLARPVPLALETGNVYAVEQAGRPEGTLDLKMARQLGTTVERADDPSGSWYGYGPFAKPSAPKTKALPPSKVTAQVSGSDDDDRPHFVAPRTQADDTAAQAKPGSRQSRTPSDEDDTERPTLSRRTDTASDDDSNGKKKKQKHDKPEGYVTGIAGGLNNDPDRPTLRHGQVQSQDTPQLEGLPAGMHQAVAVSDATSTEDHNFARSWESADERAAVLRSFNTVTTNRVREYLKENTLLASAGTPKAATEEEPATPPKLQRTPHGVSTRTQTAPPPRAAAVSVPLSMGSEQLQGYELSYGGLPTFVYTARVSAHPAQAQSADVTVYVTLVGQRLPSGEMQLALASVTDSGHLNRDPWMRFVDVVDADGSHRASLLFELRAAHSRQFALYRLISANAEQTFLSASLL